MMLSRKSGFRLRQSRWPRRRDVFRVFICSWTEGGGRRGGPLEERKTHKTIEINVKEETLESCFEVLSIPYNRIHKNMT
jgi:hypothetical protein